MSCIYGPHQFGTEDQGWVAHFLLQVLRDFPITLYGDGRQVRDVLFVEDLVGAFRLAMSNVDRITGRAFNMGGGPKNAISLLELLRHIDKMHGSLPRIQFDEWRVGDQRYYVSDTSAFQRATGWSPKVSVTKGIRELYQWLRSSETQEAKAKAKLPAAVAL